MKGDPIRKRISTPILSHPSFADCLQLMLWIFEIEDLQNLIPGKENNENCLRN